LVLAFQVKCSPHVADELAERQALADLAGRAEFRLAGLGFALKHSRKLHVFPFESADLRAVFDEKGCGGWNLEVVVRATFLATHALNESIGLAERVAAGLGNVLRSRLRRLDLCADFVGFGIGPDDVGRLATTRTGADAFMAEAKDLDEADGKLCQAALRQHHNRRLEVTGLTVAAGNPVMARIYDKSAELALPGREEKRAIEHAIWQQAGWSGTEQVTRVEFQHRGDFLDEIRLRDVETFPDRLDAVWQRDVEWLRLVDPHSATRRSRCRLDPRWEAVVRTVFEHPADPIPRSRANRGGAQPSHVFGTALSRLAATSRLERCEFGATADGEILDETRFAQTLAPPDAEKWVVREVCQRMQAAGEDVASALLGQYGPSDAVRVVATRINASVARFASVDDVRTPPTRKVSNG
jgi:hypothetical protein